MKKRLISVITVLVLMFTMMSMTAFAADTQDVTAAPDMLRVYDLTDSTLNQTDILELNLMLEDYSSRGNGEYAVVFTNSQQGYTIEDYARECYFEIFGNEGTGSIYVVSFENRDFTVQLFGDAMQNISKSESDKIIDKTSSMLTNGDYVGACKKYIEMAEEAFLKDTEIAVFKTWWVNLIIGLVVALIVTLILGHQQKSKMTAFSRDYAATVTPNPGGNWDHFTHTTVVKTKRESSSSGGGSNRGSSGKF